MAKIYLLIVDDGYEGYRFPEGIYSTRELAEEAIKVRWPEPWRDKREIHEMDVDLKPEPPEPAKPLPVTELQSPFDQRLSLYPKFYLADLLDKLHFSVEGPRAYSWES